MPPPLSTRRGLLFRYRRMWVTALLVLIAAPATWYLLSADSRLSERLLREANHALNRGDFATGEQLGRALMSQRGHSASGRFITAKALSHLGNVDQAVELLKQIPDDDLQFAHTARVFAGELLLFHSHFLSAAEESFRRALLIDPHNARVHAHLSYVYGVAGLTWRAVPHRMALLCGNRYGSIHLLLLALGPTHEEESDAIQRYYTADPNDPLAICGMALEALRENRTDDAVKLLRRVLADHPEWSEPQALYGALLLQDPNPDGFRNWLATLPDVVTVHPEIWFVRGTFARQQQDLRGAVRCFGEAVHREPNHQAANFQLAQTLLLIGESENAQPFLRRARLLEDLLGAAKLWQISKNSEDAIQRAVKISTELGLVWEARGWQRLLNSPGTLSTLPSPRASIEASASLDTVLQTYRAARNGDTLSSRLGWDPAEYPLPQVAVSQSHGQPAGDSVSTGDEIRFENHAPAAGLDFVYVNGSRPETAGQHIYESTGGGVGAFDYDLDGWPDLYFTQGCDWPPQPRQSRHIDRLYRNVTGERFEDVTADAGWFENGFGQGLAVGDLDNDGFPDVYVANIGANRLFRNNGDGTFTEIAAATNVAGNEWSTSCAIADLNGDSLPDIYVVNYIEDAEMFVHPCHLKDGRTRLCTPYEFDAAFDRLYLNLGDGSFREVSSESGILVPNGKGLGVVAADFDHSGRIDLFVANDTVPNFFFHNRTAQPGDAPVFDEQSFVTGLAVDAVGQSQACMGVAYGDANGDGQFDLFVTNFHNESNTLYVQRQGLIFSDVTRSADLHEPGFALLGFGTQFIDGDLDGLPDLVVTNGHVGDLSHSGVPYQMPTQVFHNVGSGMFEVLPAWQLGEFFEENHLGRGLARLDWNRDGLDDFAVSHLEEPVALLTNRTRSANQFLALRLHGVASSRDAVGTTVIVTCGTLTMTRQVTSGDGYLASNERRLTFGLGQNDRVDKMEVRWPSGLVQTFLDLPGDAELLVIEGVPQPISLAPAGGH